MSLPNYVIQKFWDKANSSNTDVMLWSDFLDCMTELKVTATTTYTLNPVLFDDLPEYADDAAAVAGGLPSGALYRTSAGSINQVLPAV
jgi:hypothetical protein